MTTFGHLRVMFHAFRLAACFSAGLLGIAFIAMAVFPAAFQMLDVSPWDEHTSHVHLIAGCVIVLVAAVVKPRNRPAALDHIANDRQAHRRGKTDAAWPFK
ncbi:hypothetical protein [Paraburkholderia sp. SIMBA_054]|uniref:hypothetical protein n=1 Tax=Paraburkholderia sp. SIMBA_054 TaxID=3085795 RepID=UPI00397AEBF1